MNIQILPNWTKKLSIVVFLLTSFIAGSDDFIAGFNAASNKSSLSYSTSITKRIGGESVIQLFEIIAILALVTYMLSKEKVEDDYINILRLESYQLSFIVVSGIALIFLVLDKDFFYGSSDSLSLIIWLYLIIFYFKKRLV